MDTIKHRNLNFSYDRSFFLEKRDFKEYKMTSMSSKLLETNPLLASPSYPVRYTKFTKKSPKECNELYNSNSEDLSFNTIIPEISIQGKIWTGNDALFNYNRHLHLYQLQEKCNAIFVHYGLKPYEQTSVSCVFIRFWGVPRSAAKCSRYLQKVIHPYLFFKTIMKGRTDSGSIFSRVPKEIFTLLLKSFLLNEIDTPIINAGDP